MNLMNVNTYAPGQQVRVHAGSPVHADLTGTVTAPEIRGGMPGYWILPNPGCVRAWVPAKWLELAAVPTPEDGGETR